MNLVILFEKIALANISGDRDAFCTDLCIAGKILNLTKGDDNIDVKLLEGELPNAPEKEKVVILVSSDQMMPNMGKYVVEFKGQVIKAFEKVGIQLDRESLAVKMNKPYDIDALIKKVRKIENQNKSVENKDSDEFDYEQKSRQYVPVEPLYSFERVILPRDVLEKIEEAIGILECEDKVFNEWGLYEIQPHPSTSLSFYGPSGTGKTMAARQSHINLEKKY